MANPRAFINSFVKTDNHMRRNTENTKWVTDGGRSVTQRAGPQKDVQILEPKSQYGSQKASVFRNLNGVSPETGHIDAARDEMKQISVETGQTSATLNDYTKSQAVAIDLSGLEQTSIGSDGAPISYYSTDDDTHAGNSQGEPATSHDSVPWYRAAKHIYDIGPEGEGQRAWKAYQHIRKQHKNGGARVDKTVQTREEIVLKYEKPLPLPPSSGPDGVLFLPLRPRSAETRGETKGDNFEKPCPRKDSVFSQLSYEVPIAIDKSIRSTIDANKPLPPIPRLDAAPRVRQKTGQTFAPSPSLKMKPEESARTFHANQSPEKASAHTWWRLQSQKDHPILKSKISHPGPLIASSDGLTANVAVECGGVGGPSAAISLPVTRNGAPLPQPQNAYVAKKNVKKPPPLNLHLPILHPVPLQTRANAKDKGKPPNQDETSATHWRDIFVGPAYEVGKSFKQTAMERLDGVHLGRKRRNSDASFMCQGIKNEALDRYQVSQTTLSSQTSSDDESLVPAPLFAAKRTNRNTKFYEPYIEVLDEY